MRQPPFRPRSQFADAAREYRHETERTPPPLPPRWETTADRPNGSRPPIQVVEGQQSKTTVELTCASTLKAEPVDWLWRGWLARGKLHIIGGQPGAGQDDARDAMARRTRAAVYGRMAHIRRSAMSSSGLARTIRPIRSSAAPGGVWRRCRARLFRRRCRPGGRAQTVRSGEGYGAAARSHRKGRRLRPDRRRSDRLRRRWRQSQERRHAAGIAAARRSGRKRRMPRCSA